MFFCFPLHAFILKRDRKQRLITHRRCFIAEEAVDWMLENLPVRGRADAVELGQKLVEQHFIQPVNRPSKSVFRDSKKDLYLFSANVTQSYMTIFF